MEHNVTGCRDCPFYNDGQDYEFAHYCNHPKSPQEVNRFYSEPKIEIVYEKVGEYNKQVPVTPDFCPLKKEPITIKMNE